MNPAALSTNTDNFPKPHFSRHRAFCRALALGTMSQQDAYKRYVRARGGGNLTTMKVNGCILARKFGQYIAQLREKLHVAGDAAFIADKTELMQRDTRTIRAQAMEAANPESDLATVTIIDGPDGRTVKSVGPSKDEAAQRLIKMRGYDAPAQVHVSHALIESPALALLESRLGQRITQGKAEPLPDVIEAELIDVDEAIGQP